MIVPTKYLDLQASIVNVSAYVMGCLVARGPIKYDFLLSLVENEVCPRARFQLPYALGLCYLVGVADYDSEADIVYSTSPEREVSP